MAYPKENTQTELLWEGVCPNPGNVKEEMNNDDAS